MSLKRGLARGVANALALGLGAGGRPFYRYVVDALWERHPSWEPPAGRLEIALQRPEYVTPDPEDRAIVERIFGAYARAKRAQAQCDAVFLPSSGWQSVIDRAFSPLAEGLAAGDRDRFHFFLANFRAWKQTTGMEPSERIWEYAADPHKREHFERAILAPILGWWIRCEADGRDLSALALPPHGNACGALVDGHLIAPSSVFCEVYGRLLAGFVPGERPVVAELGGGFGKLCYFVARNLERFGYVGVDLPESLCCAAYFLLKAFPERRFLLYGEAEFTPASLAEYDFILLPSFEISGLPDRGADLFVNENSLGVMTPDACRLFVSEICRASRAFWHRNTEASRLEFDDGTRSLINREFPIPEDEFELVARYCDVSRLMSGGRLNFDSDMYWYYYRRLTKPPPGARLGDG